MSVVISDELQHLFDLRDHRAAAIERFILAEAEMQGYMQQNTHREFVEVHDLDITYKLVQPVQAAKKELEEYNSLFEQKKKFFISLIEATGCTKLHCTNKEFDEHGNFEYVPYVIAISKNLEGNIDLIIHQVGAAKI